MLQDIRKNAQGTVAKIIVGLIVISFSIFGIESLLFSSGSGSVAEVNGEPISPQEVQQLVTTQQRQLMAAMGDNLDPALLDSQRLTGIAVQTLIQQKLMQQSAEHLNLAVSDEVVGLLITSMPQFQRDGQFDETVYRSILGSAGFSPQFFQQSVKNDLVVNQLRSGLVGSEFITGAEVSVAAVGAAEQRDIRYLRVSFDDYRAEAEIDEQAVGDYYTAHPDEFMTPESVVLEYVELTPELFFEPVDEQDVLAEYELTLQDYQYATERRVSHILFEQKDDESDPEFLARIADVKVSLDAGGDFAALAREHSDDIGSASFGGDLGLTQGDTFPAEMEEAIESLAVNVASDAVETDAGTHLILVTELREGEAPSLAELRMELEQSIQERGARATLVRKVDELKNRIFNATDLAEPAAELDLELKVSEAVTREQAGGLFANTGLLAQAFSTDVLNEGYNSEVVELAGDRHVALRLKVHNQPELRPLEAVRDGIATSIALEQARERVNLQAMNALVSLRDGQSVESFANEHDLDWQVELAAQRDSATAPPQMLRRAFQLPPPASGDSVFEYVMTAEGDALVFEVARVSPGNSDSLVPEQKLALRRQLGRESTDMLDQQYVQGLRAEADITGL